MAKRTAKQAPPAAQPARLLADWRVLCEDIGLRLAGTPGEQRAAHHVAAEFTRSGLAHVHQEDFPCTSLRHGECEVFVREQGQWQPVLANFLIGAPSTAGTVEGNLVWLHLPENGPRLTPGSLRGHVAVVFGSLPMEVALHRRLVAAEPLAVLVVDHRLPFAWAKNDGVFPVWTRRYGMPPTVAISYTEAWRWRRLGLDRARVRVTVDYAVGRSQNVVAEIPGQRPDREVIVVGAHHDTQNNNVGADDNASGVVGLLELARLLHPRPLRRTIRFVSFGCEEQLSVGSHAYVVAHRRELAQIGFVLNLDSYASVLGHYHLYRAGAPAVARWATACLAAHGVDVVPMTEVCPFADHFCFNVFGIPALWLYRVNTSDGRWQHHSAADSLENISALDAAHVLDGFADFLAKLATAPRLPFPRGLPPDQEAQTQRLARTLYGLHA